MKFRLIQFNELMQDLIKEKPLEESLSQIVRTIEEEFNFNSLGIFLKVPGSEIFRLKIGRSLSHTFSKSTIFTEGDPLIVDLSNKQLIDLRTPATYSFEHEYSHLIISPLNFYNKLLGFVFLDRSNGFYESEELTKLHLFSSFIAMIVFIDAQSNDLARHKIEKQQVPIYDHAEFLDRAKTVFAMMMRYKRYMTIAVFKIESYRNLTRIYGEKKTRKYVVGIENIFIDNLRETDFIGRLEKDTIVLLMPETPQKNAMISIDRLNSMISELHTLKFIKTGWGISNMSDEIETFEEMLKVTTEAADESARRLKGEPLIVGKN